MPTLDDIKAHLESHTEHLRAHPFFTWVSTVTPDPTLHEDEATALRRHVRDRLSWHVLLAQFIMGFRDLNLYHLKYDDPSTVQKRAINEHADEDATHSALYLVDLETLARSGEEHIPISEVLWLLHHDALTAPFRAFVASVMRYVVHNRERPIMLYTVIECLELMGNVLFTSTAAVASAYQRVTGDECVYWGEYHLERESGDLQTTTHDEAFPDELELTDAEYTFALDHIDRLFGAFVDLCNRMHSYGQTSGANHDARSIAWALLRRRHGANVNRWLALDVARCQPRTAELPLWPPGLGDGLHSSQRLIARRWSELRDQLRAHPALAGVRAAARGPTALATMRAMTMIWAPRILGTHSFWLTLGGYPERADSPARRRINGYATRYQASPSMLYTDWQSLRLDEVLDWRPSESLRFFFLDDALERQRQSMARLIQLAISHADPVVRYWFVVAVETGADAVLGAASELARVVEREDPLRPLHYWNVRHRFAHDVPLPDDEARALHPAGLPLSLGRAELALGVLDTILGDFMALLDEHEALVGSLCQRFSLQTPPAALIARAVPERHVGPPLARRSPALVAPRVLSAG